MSLIELVDGPAVAERAAKPAKKAAKAEAKTEKPAKAEKAEAKAEKAEAKAETTEAKALDEHTLEELRQMAASIGLEGRSKMKKDELIAALRERRDELDAALAAADKG
jgi:hypothetical protein